MTPKINQVKTDESMNNGNVVNESINNVSSKGESKLKKAVNNAIAKMAIVLSLTGTAAPEVATSTIVPEAVATITTMTPATGATLKAIAIGTSGALLTACEKPDDIGPEVIKEMGEIPISGGEIFIITGNQVKIGNTVVQEFWDDVSANNVTISSNFDGSTISSGKPIDKSGRVTSIARDQAGNPSRTAKTHITKKETAEKPKCSLHIPEITISEGDTVIQKGKDIIAGTQKIFAWESDDYIFSTNVDLPYTVSNNIDIKFSLSIKGGQPETRTTTIKVNQVDNNPAPEVTREYPQDKVPNILGGVTVKGDNNQLTFGDVVMYSGKDDNTEVCTISLKLNDEEKIGKKISESSTYILTYTDKDGKSSSPIEFPVISESVDLTNLNLNMQVNQEVDLLEGIKVPSGIEITKVEVEINGQRQEVKAKDGRYLYTPDQAGTCYIYVTEKGEFGNTYVDKPKDPLTIKALDYKEATLNTVDIISKQYPWYNVLYQQKDRDFIYPHLLASYAACNRSKQSNIVNIMMGESTDANGVENIGQFFDASDTHALEGSHRIRIMCPDASIKGCFDFCANLEKYVKEHPDNFFVISIAAGGFGGNSLEALKANPETAPLERLLENKNVIIVCSGGNRAQSGWKMYNENEENGNRYNAGSTNSKLNNKITVIGYSASASDNYFSPNHNIYGGLRGAMLVGYEKDKGNLVMPMIPLVTSGGLYDTNTTSSMPTNVVGGDIRNIVSIIISNNPGITPEDAMTIAKNNYLTKMTFQYMDETTNRELKDGCDAYPFDMRKLLEHELLQSDKMDKLQFNKNEVELPSGPGLCIMGRGVMFEYKGKQYSTTDNNQSLLIQALKSGNVKYIWNKDLYTQQGGNGSVKMDVYVVDKDGNKFPDLHLVIERNIN